jgi:hypothetical protein
MRKLTVLVLITLLIASSSVSMAKQRKAIHKPRPAAVAATQGLLPEAAALRDAQRFWPGVPLCDEGGYRIRPCYMNDGGGRQ